MPFNIERLVLLEDMNSSLPPQKKLLGSSELSCSEEYMKDCVTGGSAAGSVELLLHIFFLTCLFLLDFILDNIPEVFMTKILCTWLLTLEKSLFLKRSLDGWHGWPQRKGRNFIQKSKEKDMKEKAKRKGKREFEYASHRPIEFTFYLYWVTWGTVLNAEVKLQGAF